jgi:hypothetical protein
MKKLAASLATATLLTSAMSTVALASTQPQPQHKMYQTQIILNHHTVSSPKGLVSGNTMYIPIWYVMHALNNLGIQNRWDGHKWYLTTSSSEQVDLSNVRPGSGSSSIYLNGKLVQRVTGIVDVVPASHQKTTYMPIWYVMQVLHRAHFDSSWNGSKWELARTADELKALRDAFANTDAAIQKQMTGTMNMKMNLNLTPQGKKDVAGSGLGPDGTMMRMQIKMSAQTGLVQGEKAAFITMLMNPSRGATQDPGSILEEYIQGNHVYENTGDGWNEVPNSQDPAQLFQFQLSNIQLAMLKNIQAQPTDKGYQYTANLNNSALESLINPILDSLSAPMDTASGSTSDPTSGPTPEQLKQFIDALLQRTIVNVQFDVMPVQEKYYISSEQAHVTMNVPSKLADKFLYPGSSSQDNAQFEQDVASISIDIMSNVGMTYRKLQFVPPAHLPSSTGKSNTSSNAAGASH